MKPHHIVIVGAGFGGTYVARHLAKHINTEQLRITLINRTNYFLFTPLLHEVATGSLTPTSVTEALGEIFAGTGVQIIVGDATVNLKEKQVKVNGTEIPFDYLVLTTGAETNYFNIPGAREHALPLKTVGDAMRIREQILRSFEEAHACKSIEDRRRMLSFVIAGGGPTGVELAAEIAEFANEIEKRYHHAKGDLSMHLITADDFILKMLPERLRRMASAYLQKLGVRIVPKKTVTEVTENSVRLHDGTNIDAGLVLWTAGVTPDMPKMGHAMVPCEHNRMSVNQFLQVPDHPQVFAIGDLACAHDTPNNGKPVPMLAQAATTQAKITARNIIASIHHSELSPFRFHTKGVLVSLGEWKALGTIGPFHISGPIAWYIWRTVYLFKFLSVKKRFLIAFEWTYNLFTPRDTSKLG